jgi:NADH-quinone oxidoreductase subunit K
VFGIFPQPQERHHHHDVDRADALAVNINFVAFSVVLGDLVGQVFAMFVLTVAAAEAAIGLAILVVYFRNRGTIQVEDIHMMRG